MKKQIACADVVSGCAWEAGAENEEELMGKVVSHASETHGVTEVSPELAAKVRAAIRTGADAE
jgi:predicted small metal-binding protein